MPETRKSKRFEAIRFKRSLLVADFDYLSTVEIILVWSYFVKRNGDLEPSLKKVHNPEEGFITEMIYPA
jgi:hypothetical protein